MSTINVQWTIFNPGLELSTNFQQVGGYLGTGDQANYLKFVAIQHPEGEFEIVLEDADEIESASYLQANNLFNAPDGSRIFLNMSIDIATGIATPTATYETANGTTTVTGASVSLGGTAVLDAIRGDHTVNGQTTGLAVGLFSSNTGASPDDTFTAIFDDISISAE